MKTFIYVITQLDVEEKVSCATTLLNAYKTKKEATARVKTLEREHAGFTSSKKGPYEEFAGDRCADAGLYFSVEKIELR